MLVPVCKQKYLNKVVVPNKGIIQGIEKKLRNYEITELSSIPDLSSELTYFKVQKEGMRMNPFSIFSKALEKRNKNYIFFKSSSIPTTKY